jgi:thiol-disulfide isomerase/thioredoxin
MNIDINKKNNIEKNIYKNLYGIELGILELKLKDFNYKNKKLYINNNYFNNKGFIIFYAPWCKHCKNFMELIKDLALSNINLFNFGAVNCEDIKNGNDYLCANAKIKQFPTLKYIKKDGSLENYKYEYNFDNLVYFINT